MFKMDIIGKSDSGELAQIPMTIYAGGITAAVITWNGTEGKWVTKTEKIYFNSGYNTIKLHFGQSGLELKSISFTMC
jgi:beta-glucosidase